MLTREQILQPRKLRTESVECPELGDDVSLVVKTLTAREFLELSNKTKAQPDLAYAHWIVATVVDADGKRIFTEEDATALAEQAITLVERLSETAQRLNLTKKGAAAKNSASQS